MVAGRALTPQGIPTARAELLNFTVSSGHQHPHLQAFVGNYAVLLQMMGRSQKEVLEQLNAVGRAFGIKFGGEAYFSEAERVSAACSHTSYPRDPARSPVAVRS